MILDENLFEAKSNDFEKISDMIYQALTRLGYLVNADKVGYAITKRIDPSKKLVSRQDKDFDFVTDEQLTDAKALLTKANIGYFVKRLLNQPTLYVDLTNFDVEDVNTEALERSIEDRFKGWLRKLYTKKYKDKSDDEIIKAFLTFVKYDANDDEITELESILDRFKSNKEKMLTESVADLTSIKIPSYVGTWSPIDVFTTPMPDVTRYFLMENDKYGDETQYLVVSEDLSEVYETYDDIETALRDEGILESLDEDIVKTSKGKWVNKGKEGTHGEFTTKKKAREQQKAMFAQGFKGEAFDSNLNESTWSSVIRPMGKSASQKLDKLVDIDRDLVDDLEDDVYEKTAGIITSIFVDEYRMEGNILRREAGEPIITDEEYKNAVKIMYDTINDYYNKYVLSDNSINENIGSDIAEYQKWVDYDMKKYGRISSLTNHKVRKAGLKIVKDKYGDYEVIANEPIRENIEESSRDFYAQFDIRPDRKIKEVYTEISPEEYQLDKIHPTKTIADIWSEMQAGEDFYRIASDDGEGFDSAVREGIFEIISKAFKIPYDAVYLTWRNGGKLEESLKNNEIDDFFDKAKRLGVKTLKDLKILLAQSEAKGDSEKEKLDNYSKEANPDNKDLSEDVEVVDKNQAEIDKKAGLENLLNDLINDENEAINGYNSAIVNFELEGKSDLTSVFRDIIKDEQNHIGNLQKVLNEINPSTIANLEQGQQEAADTLNK